MNAPEQQALTPLEYLYHWEKTRTNDLYMTQPMGNDQVKTYTWGETAQEVRKLANYFKSLDLPEKSQIALISKNCAHWIITDLAIWMAGHISVPLYPTLHADNVKAILDHSESKVVVVGKLDDWDMMKDGVSQDLPTIGMPLAPADPRLQSMEDIISKTAPMTDSPIRDRNELGTIVYTSGSTGMPKGVMTSFHALTYAATGAVKELDLNHTDRVLSYLPLSHVFERYVVEMGSIASGYQIFFAESLDTFVQDLQRARPTLFISVPRLWTKFQAGVLAKKPQEKLDKLFRIPLLNKVVKKKVLAALGLDKARFAGSGSAPLSAEILQWYRQLGLELLEGYGMTENFCYSHMTKPGRTKVGYVGEPMSGVKQRISEIGEIEINSPANMMGYFKEPEKTAEVLDSDNWLKTGDRGEIDEMGRLKLTGRVKELFKTSKGKYVAPAPIENRIVSNSNIELACVAGANQTQPCCIINLAEHAYEKRKDPAFRQALENELTELVKSVNAQLDPHEHLAFIAVTDQLWQIENGFLTPTMKLKRNIIEEEYAPKVDGWYKERKTVVWEA